jgi:hypothetical protein
MFALFTLYLALLSTPTWANDPLKGKSFKYCDSDSKLFDQSYSVEYSIDGEEFEGEVYREKNSKTCKGRALFAIGRIWNYEINANDLITTLKEIKVIVTDKKTIDVFNKNEFCGIKNWKLNTFVSCEGKNVFGDEGVPGERTIHKFKIHKNELIATNEDGETRALTQEK